MAPFTHVGQAPSGWIFLTGAVLVAAMVGLESVPALAIMLLDGGAALGVLAAAGLAGGWVVRWLGMRDEPWAERLIVGAGLGIGLLSLVVLGLGSLGWLTRTTAFLVVGGAAAAGLARLAMDLHELGVFRVSKASRGEAAEGSEGVSLGAAPERSLRWLWLLVCPFVAIMVLAACLPPGVLWREEGFGYDVLEYHLAVPKIFFEQGRITFLANNVYSNFPLNSEMLSLLMMTLRGDAIEAAFMAVFVNVGLAGLLAAGAWLAGRRFSWRAGTIAGVLALTTPWITYLAGIAYVEVGMLAMGMCALAVALRSGQKRFLTPFCAGLLAGLACGYKYTAVPLVALPVGLVLLAGERTWARRGQSLLVYALGAMVTFSPWLIRNTVNTGNPVFPLAYSVFGDRSGTWDEGLNGRWERVHGTAAAEHTNESFVCRAWARTGGDFRLGAATLVLAGIGAIRRRDRWTAALVAMLVVQISIWLAVTHLFARFAVVMLLPGFVLAGRALAGGSVDEDSRANGRSNSPPRSPPLVRGGEQPARSLPAGSTGGGVVTWGLVGLLMLGSTWNLYGLAQLYLEHTRVDGGKLDAYGHTGWFASGQWPGTQHWGTVNALPVNARVMLVGEARTFYLERTCDYAVVFNRHPLAEAVDRVKDPAAVLGWLRQRGTTHLLVHWGEVGRLSSTYGFPPELQDPQFYQGLVRAGLKETVGFTYPGHSEPYATLFEVPRP